MTSAAASDLRASSSPQKASWITPDWKGREGVVLAVDLALGEYDDLTAWACQKLLGHVERLAVEGSTDDGVGAEALDEPAPDAFQRSQSFAACDVMEGHPASVAQGEEDCRLGIGGVVWEQHEPFLLERLKQFFILLASHDPEHIPPAERVGDAGVCQSEDRPVQLGRLEVLLRHEPILARNRA